MIAATGSALVSGNLLDSVPLSHPDFNQCMKIMAVLTPV
jgi:hypothetical protein